MRIVLNGEAREIPEGSTAAMLIDTLGLERGRLAFEVNREILPRSELQAHELQPGDRVEIIHAIGGG